MDARAEAPLDPEFNAIVTANTETNHPQSLLRMERWVDVHPGDPQSARGLLWMAQLERQDGHDSACRPLLERVVREGQGTEWALHAEKQLADLDVESHRYQAAIDTYERLSRLPSPFWKYVGARSAADARSRRLRFQFLFAALALLFGVGLHRIAKIGPRALWPLPPELAYPLPVLLVIFLAAFAQEKPERLAVLTLSLGAIALLWINGSYLRAHPPRGAARILQALLGLLQALAVVYCAIIASGLWEKVVDTWQMGAD